MLSEDERTNERKKNIKINKKDAVILFIFIISSINHVINIFIICIEHISLKHLRDKIESYFLIE